MTYRDLEKLSDALYYQLNERVSFVKPKEKIVAQLFFDLGNVAFLMGHYSDAVLDYKEAQKYGFKGALILKRIEESGKLALQQPKQRKRTVIAQPQYTMGLIAGILLLIMAVIIIVKRRRNKS
jgi:hypothetical protein